MPDASDEIITHLETKLSEIDSITEMFENGKTPEDILEALLGDIVSSFMKK